MINELMAWLQAQLADADYQSRLSCGGAYEAGECKAYGRVLDYLQKAKSNMYLTKQIGHFHLETTQVTVKIRHENTATNFQNNGVIVLGLEELNDLEYAVQCAKRDIEADKHQQELRK